MPRLSSKCGELACASAPGERCGALAPAPPLQLRSCACRRRSAADSCSGVRAGVKPGTSSVVRLTAWANASACACEGEPPRPDAFAVPRRGAGRGRGRGAGVGALAACREQSAGRHEREEDGRPAHWVFIVSEPDRPTAILGAIAFAAIRAAMSKSADAVRRGGRARVQTGRSEWSSAVGPATKGEQTRCDS